MSEHVKASHIDTRPQLLVPTRTLELHKWRRTKVEGVAALEPPKSQRGIPIKLDWLPIAAGTYNISSDPRDYVISEVPLVTADVPNRNRDCFPFRQLMSWNRVVGRVTYRTFIGKPTHEDHDNKDPLKAKGANFDASIRRVRTQLSKESGGGLVRVHKVFVLSGFDRTKDRDLARSILRGDRRAYSMGALVDLTLCSVCWQTTSGRRNCRCIGAKKGSVVNGKLKYDVCHGINFIENSSVGVGADHTAISDEWW